jgi:hypothetical protein
LWLRLVSLVSDELTVGLGASGLVLVPLPDVGKDAPLVPVPWVVPEEYGALLPVQSASFTAFASEVERFAQQPAFSISPYSGGRRNLATTPA